MTTRNHTSPEDLRCRAVDLLPANDLLALFLLPLFLLATPGLSQVPAGPDDARLTHVEPNADPARRARRAATAYSETQDLFLVAWIADDAAFGLVDNEQEVFVAIVDSVDSTVLSPVLQVSSVGPIGDPMRAAFEVDVAWGALDDTFLVVWDADDAEFGLESNQTEVFARRVQWTPGGGWTTTPTVKLSSSAGMPPDTDRSAAQPTVAWGDDQNEWLVVWTSDNKNAALSPDEFELFARRVSSGGFAVGPDARITTLGIPGDPQSASFNPRLAYEMVSDRFFVVWRADNVGPGWVDGHYEVHGKSVAASNLADLGPTIQISAVGSTLDASFDARAPSVAISEASGAIVVVWNGNFESGAIHPDKQDIWGVALDSDGSPLGGQVRIGQMGDALDPETGGFSARVSWTPQGDQFLIAWHGNDEAFVPDGPLLVDQEIWSRSIRISAESAVGPLIRISNMGGTSPFPASFDASDAAIATGSEGRLLVVWQGDDDEDGLVDDETEIFGELVRGNWIFVDGFESGSVAAWSP
ncbi:MAG: hypothetical protein K8J08_17105 [Thermoanaerobaculia bacterium]|nr:hypothetical protein [Thermoanaerobaculia bacterium]